MSIHHVAVLGVHAEALEEIAPPMLKGGPIKQKVQWAIEELYSIKKGKEVDSGDNGEAKAS